jgi:serine/threonine protein kinase
VFRAVRPGEDAERTVSAPQHLDLEELEEGDLGVASALEDATMSIRPQVLGDTSIPTIAKSVGRVNDLQTLAPSLVGDAVANDVGMSPDDVTPPSLILPQAEATAHGQGGLTTVSGSDSTGSSAGFPKGVPPNRLGFNIIRQVGVGGYGEVLEATQFGLGRTIAVKRLKPENVELAMQNPSTRKWMELLFQQEAIITALLEHPNIVPIHNFIKDLDGRPNLTMKLVRGLSWDKIIEEDLGKIPQSDYLTKHLSILIDVAQAVGFAHAHGIVHRDLKPQQVMVGEFGEVILMDWGLALVFDDTLLPLSIRDTPQGHILPRPHDAPSPAGSPAFMAPEQTARSAVHVGPWTDVFMLGGILYAILTGTPPHRRSPGQKADAVFKLAAKCVIDPPEVRAPDMRIPTELANLAMDCLRREPAARLGSVSEFISRLQDYLTGATRRRESRALTDRVALELNETHGDYRKLSECDSQLDRALFLWPENPDGLSLREQCLQLYAEAAMANEDLALARVQAERLPPHHDARAELLMEIGVLENLVSREALEAREAELERRKADSHRRRSEELLQRAEQGRIAAIEARAFAESLLEHLVGDLIGLGVGTSLTTRPDQSGETVAPMGSARAKAALLAAAGRISTYFEATEADDITDRMIAQRARTCDRLSEALSSSGEQAEATRMARMAQTYLDVLQKREAIRLRGVAGTR